MWKPQSGNDVWPGQDWEMPDGDVAHVGALYSDSMERTVLCTLKAGGVLHMPADALFKMATYLGGRW